MNSLLASGLCVSEKKTNFELGIARDSKFEMGSFKCAVTSVWNLAMLIATKIYLVKFFFSIL